MLLKYDVEQTPESRVHSFAIKKHGAPTLRLAADTEEAAARWATVVREAVERNDQVASDKPVCLVRPETLLPRDREREKPNSLATFFFLPRSTLGWTRR